LHQTVFGQASHDIGERRAVNSRQVNQAGLACSFLLSDRGQNSKLPGGQIRLADGIAENTFGGLTRSVEQMQRSTPQICIGLHHGLRLARSTYAWLCRR
jgi:hypothetical protein